MNRSTRIFRRAAGLPLLLALLIFAASGASADVSARASAEISYGPVASARQTALDSALASAVGTIASRHTVPGQRAELSERLRAIIGQPRLYILRYKIVSEGPGEGWYRVRLQAQVDTERLLADLEKAGFKVMRLDARPRILVGATAEAPSRDTGRLVAGLLSAEGYDSEFLDAPLPSGEDASALCRMANSRGFHVAALVAVPSAVEEPAPEPLEGQEQPPPETLEPPPPQPELDAVAAFFDTRKCEALGRSEMTVIGEGADPEATAADAVEQAADEISQALMAAVVQSGWTPGDTAMDLRLKITGLASAGQVSELTRLLSAVAEFKAVNLDRVEPGAAVWRVRAVGAGYDWLPVLGGVKPGAGALRWVQTVGDPGEGTPPSGKPLYFEGRWNRQ